MFCGKREIAKPTARCVFAPTNQSLPVEPSFAAFRVQTGAREPFANRPRKRAARPIVRPHKHFPTIDSYSRLSSCSSRLAIESSAC